MSKTIGIDLGTTNSCVSIIKDEKPFIIHNVEGARTTPSIVAFSKSGEVLVGASAKRQAVANPKNTFYAVKRLIGRKFTDEEVEKEKELAPYNIVEMDNGAAGVEVNGKKFTPQQISAKILQKMKTTAEEWLGENVTDAVITVPAYFTAAQRQATKDAGRIAGLRVERIINEPTAAALAYGLDQVKESKVIAVFDLGGGTFDISIINLLIDGDGDKEFKVLATNGDTFLGGEDFDQVLMSHLVDHFKKESGIDAKANIEVLQRIKAAAETAKIELSTTLESEINLPYLSADSTGSKHLVLTLTRPVLEGLVADLISRTEKPCRTALADAKLENDKVDEVILVGGMTRMPAVQKKVEEIFQRKPRKDINADEAVAMGAAIQGAVMQNDICNVMLLDVTSLSLGIELIDDGMSKLIDKNTTIPTRESDVYTTTKDNQPVIEINVLQGEGINASENTSLGKFKLDEIPPQPQGEPQIEVTFDINANGIIHVTAKNQATGRENHITIQSSGLSEKQIQDMTVEAAN